MNWTHIAACILKGLFALVAYLTWADETKEVITDNLPSGIRAVVNLFLVSKALLSYPAAVLRRRGCPGKVFLPRRRACVFSGLLRGRRASQIVGSFAPLRTSCVHYAYGYIRAALCASHGSDGKLDGRGFVLSPPQLISSQVVVEKALVASGLLSTSPYSVIGGICSISGFIHSVEGLIEAYKYNLSD